MTARPGPNPGTWLVDKRPMVQMTAGDCGCPFVMFRGLFSGRVITCGVCDWCKAHEDLLRPARAGDEVTIDVPCRNHKSQVDGRLIHLVDTPGDLGRGGALGNLHCQTCDGTGSAPYTFTLKTDPEWWDHDRDYNTVAAVVLTERSNDG